MAIHNNEQKEIERNLANLVPENFSDVCTLLEFATVIAEGGGSMVYHAEIDMLRNARSGVSLAWQNIDLERRDEMEAEREKARKEGIARVRGSIEWAVPGSAGYVSRSTPRDRLRNLLPRD